MIALPKPKALKQHPELDASVIHPSGICGPYDYAFGSVTCMVRDFVRGNMKMGIEGTFNSVDVRDLLSKNLAHIGVRILALVSRFTGKEPLLSEFNIYMLNR